MADWREMGESLKFIKEVSDKCELLVKELCEREALVDPVARAFSMGAYNAYTHALTGIIGRAESYLGNDASDNPAWGIHPVTLSACAYLLCIHGDLQALSLAPDTTKYDAAINNNRTRGRLHAVNHMFELIERLKHQEKTPTNVESDADLSDVAPRWEEFLD